VNAYPYGNDDSVLKTNCNVAGHSGTSDKSLSVATLEQCVARGTDSRPIFDLVGNVYEWEDSCASTAANSPCRARGGSYGNSNSLYNACNGDATGKRNETSALTGFRCCSL
jgi:formylglycine-generating enzyme required for sulfatase activity